MTSPTIFRQLFDPQTSTYTYLLGDTRTGEALLIDPVLEQVDRDVKRGNLKLPRPRRMDEAVAANCIPLADRDLPILLVCRSGRRSLSAAATLASRGFSRVGSIRGGMVTLSQTVTAGPSNGRISNGRIETRVTKELSC